MCTPLNVGVFLSRGQFDITAHTHARAHTHSHTHTRNHTQTCKHIHMRTHIHTHANAHTHTHTRKCTHTHTHTQDAMVAGEPQVSGGGRFGSFSAQQEGGMLRQDMQVRGSCSGSRLLGMVLSSWCRQGSGLSGHTGGCVCVSACAGVGGDGLGLQSQSPCWAALQTGLWAALPCQLPCPVLHHTASCPALPCTALRAGPLSCAASGTACCVLSEAQVLLGCTARCLRTLAGALQGAPVRELCRLCGGGRRKGECRGLEMRVPRAQT